MVRVMKVLRWSMWVLGVALALSGLTLGVVHTRPVRRFVLTRFQAYLREHQNLALEVGDFDYNLLASRLEFKNVALKGSPSQSQAANLMARRVVVTIPPWQLALGSLEGAQVWIDRLAVNWKTSEARAADRFRMPHTNDGGEFRLPPSRQ